MGGDKALKRFVRSADGTQICFRQSGNGPGLLLIHGGLQTAGAFLKLSELLSDRFTVYRVERRGRPPSHGDRTGHAHGFKTADDRAPPLERIAGPDRPGFGPGRLR